MTCASELHLDAWQCPTPFLHRNLVDTDMNRIFSATGKPALEGLGAVGPLLLFPACQHLGFPLHLHSHSLQPFAAMTLDSLSAVAGSADCQAPETESHSSQGQSTGYLHSLPSSWTSVVKLLDSLQVIYQMRVFVSASS